MSIPDPNKSDRKKSPSKAWYLAPIFLDFIGGIIMYLVLKDDDPKMAKKGLILGIVLTIVPIIIVAAIFASFAGSSLMYR